METPHWFQDVFFSEEKPPHSLWHEYVQFCDPFQPWLFNIQQNTTTNHSESVNSDICLLHPLTKNTKNRWTLIPTNADGNNTRKIKEQATWTYAEYGYTTNPNLKFYYWIFHHINILIKTCITTLQGCLYTNKKSQTKLKK
jgi:hypothetical protein